jgi:hypothetical protein
LDTNWAHGIWRHSRWHLEGFFVLLSFSGKFNRQVLNNTWQRSMVYTRLTKRTPSDITRLRSSLWISCLHFHVIVLSFFRGSWWGLFSSATQKRLQLHWVLECAWPSYVVKVCPLAQRDYGLDGLGWQHILWIETITTQMGPSQA